MSRSIWVSIATTSKKYIIHKYTNSLQVPMCGFGTIAISDKAFKKNIYVLFLNTSYFPKSKMAIIGNCNFFYINHIESNVRQHFKAILIH